MAKTINIRDPSTRKKHNASALPMTDNNTIDGGKAEATPAATAISLRFRQKISNHNNGVRVPTTRLIERRM